MIKLPYEAADPARREPAAEERSVSTRPEAEAGELLDPAHREAVLAGLAELRRGDYASDSELGAAFRSFEQ